MTDNIITRNDTIAWWALSNSIDQWQENVLAATPDQTSVNHSDCQLCSEYYDEYTGETSCLGCPVMKFTGKSHCLDTPYYAALDALRRWQSHDDIPSRKAWQEAAQAYLNFLRSLRGEK